MSDRYRPGLPCWLDLTAPDVELARSFYRAVFGWELAESPSDYHVCYLRGRAVGAIAEVCPATPAVWTTYVATDDVAGVAAEVVRGGGRVVAAPVMVPTGEKAVVADPAGRVLGLWRSDSLPGSELFDEPGAPCWRALARTLGTFFGGLFGVVTTVDDEVAGRPAYLAVVDVEDAVATAVGLGGRLVDGPRDTAVGPRAVVADPFGALVAVVAMTGGVD